MFQIASSVGISRRNNCAYFFPKWDYQEFFLNSLPYRELTTDDDVKTLHEGSADYVEVDLPNDKIYDLFGYLQSHLWFQPYVKEIFSIFEPRPEIVDYIKNKYPNHKNKISIHVRRTDYVALQDHHTLLDKNYYDAAIKMFGKDNEFLVFSDDIDWCEENFKEYNCEFVKERPHKKELLCSPEDFNARKKLAPKEKDSLMYKKEDVTELFLMSMCKYNIIANSSFSWWAAYLNKNTDKKVIAPLKWFQEKRINKIYKDSENYMKFKAPEDWLLI
jgi:hypothetical protein